MRRFLIMTVCLSVWLSGCTGGGEAELTTTTTTGDRSPTTTTAADTGPGTTGGSGTTGGGEGTEATDTTTVGQPVESYEVAFRSSVEGGEVLWVTIPPGDYTAVDLEGLVARVREELGDVHLWELHVLDDPGAVEAAQTAESDRNEDQQRLVDQHYLASLLEGHLLRFQGPYADEGEYVLAS